MDSISIVNFLQRTPQLTESELPSTPEGLAESVNHALLPHTHASFEEVTIEGMRRVFAIVDRVIFAKAMMMNRRTVIVVYALHEGTSQTVELGRGVNPDPVTAWFQARAAAGVYLNTPGMKQFIASAREYNVLDALAYGLTEQSCTDRKWNALTIIDGFGKGSNRVRAKIDDALYLQASSKNGYLAFDVVLVDGINETYIGHADCRDQVLDGSWPNAEASIHKALAQARAKFTKDAAIRALYKKLSAKPTAKVALAA